MDKRFLHVLAASAIVFAVSAGSARADIWVAVEESRDTFNAADRTAAVILLSGKLEAEGQRIGKDNCTETYVVSHVRLGDTIIVTLEGPRGRRDGMAIGMADIPALYSQLVRALLTGRDVGSMLHVVDRTNVVVTQASPLRVQSDSLFYVKLGYGSPLNSASHGGPATGFGVRRELDAFAIDVSFFNLQSQSTRGSDYFYYGGDGSISGSWIKLTALRYANRTSNSTAYWGGGASWGAVSGSHDAKYWHGSGLQGELTAGYEMLRASNIRAFVQTDVVLPFYSARSVTYMRTGPSIVERRYVPTATLSVGLGWGRGGRAER